MLGTALAGATIGRPAESADGAFLREIFLLETEIDGKSHALETLSLIPQGNGPFPIALIAHGTPAAGPGSGRKPPISFEAQAAEFARRGYAAFVVARRGYGKSSGPVADYVSYCGGADHVALARESALDMLAAAQAIPRRPKTDGRRILAVGHSAGGLAVLSMPAIGAISGLMGIVAFAPGRGALGGFKICSEHSLSAAFAKAGSGGAISSLLAYAGNDRYFGEHQSMPLFEQYKAGNAKAVYATLPRFGGEGHFLFSDPAGIALWQKPLDAFLDANGFPNAGSPRPG